MEVDLIVPPPTHLSKKIEALSNAIASMHTDSRKIRQDFLLHCANGCEKPQQRQKTCIIWHILKTKECMEAYTILRVLQGKVKQTHSIPSLQASPSWPTRNNHDPNNNDLENAKRATDWRTGACPKEIQFCLRLCNQQRHMVYKEPVNTKFTVCKSFIYMNLI